MFEHMRNKIIYYYSVDHNHIFYLKNTDTINTLIKGVLVFHHPNHRNQDDI